MTLDERLIFSLLFGMRGIYMFCSYYFTHVGSNIIFNDIVDNGLIIYFIYTMCFRSIKLLYAKQYSIENILYLIHHLNDLYGISLLYNYRNNPDVLMILYTGSMCEISNVFRCLIESNKNNIYYKLLFAFTFFTFRIPPIFLLYNNITNVIQVFGNKQIFYIYSIVCLLHLYWSFLVLNKMYKTIKHIKTPYYVLDAIYNLYASYCGLEGMNDITTMNYGYYPVDNDLIDKQNNTMYQLYKTLCFEKINNLNEHNLKTILEVGSGRGGGIKYLYDIFKHRKYTWIGVDKCSKQVDINNIYYSDTDITFIHDDATTLTNIKDDSIDILINVESSHNYKDIDVFFKQVKRVLKKNGVFLYTDFTRTTNVNDLNDSIFKIFGCNNCINNDTNITINVLNSLKYYSDDRKKLIQKYSPKYLQSIAVQFMGDNKNSIPFLKLNEKIWTYFMLSITMPKKENDTKTK